MSGFIMAKLKMMSLVLVLRVAAAVLCFCAAIIMVTSHETTSLFGITMDAKFQYTPAFKFLVIISVVIFAYSVVLVFVSQTKSSSSGRFILATDMLATMLLTASLSAAATVGYLGKKGARTPDGCPCVD